MIAIRRGNSFTARMVTETRRVGKPAEGQLYRQALNNEKAAGPFPELRTGRGTVRVLVGNFLVRVWGIGP
jgi:hypothetical protein